MVITGYDSFSLWRRRGFLSQRKSKRSLLFAVLRRRRHTVKNVADQFSFSHTHARARAHAHTHGKSERSLSFTLLWRGGFACSTTGGVSTILWAESGCATAPLSRPSEPLGPSGLLLHHSLFPRPQKRAVCAHSSTAAVMDSLMTPDSLGECTQRRST